MKSYIKTNKSKSIILRKVIQPSQQRNSSILFDQKLEDNAERIATYLKQNIVALNESLKNEKNKESDILYNNLNNIDINIFDFKTIIYILNKPRRSTDELLIIKTYLSSMVFISTLKIPLSLDKLLHSLSLYLKLERKLKDTILFRYGSKGSKFYIVLQGEISIFILKETKQTISFKRYFLHLLLLKMLKEDELVKRTIIANSKMKYHFDDKDFDIYYENIINFANTNNNKLSQMVFNIENMEENKSDNEKENKKSKKGDIIPNSRNKANSSSKKNNSNFLRQSSKNVKFAINLKNKNNLSEEKNNIIKEKVIIIDNNNKDKDKKDSKNNNIKLKSKQRETSEKKEELTSEEEKDDLNYSLTDLPYFDLNEIKEIIFYYLHLKDMLSKKKKKISKNEYIKNTYLDSIYHKPIANEKISKKEQLVIFQYFEITKKKVGDSFGELALQKEDNKRTGTALTTSDCTLGYLTRTDYNLYLGEIEVRKRKNEINFVMSFAIFDKMNKIMFENRYFNFFTRETFLQGEVIIEQDKPLNKIYFIKEGQFEITTNLNIDKIYSLLEHKTKKVINENKKIKIKNQNFNLRLYISNNKDILGLEDCANEEGLSFVTAKCLSSQAIAFTIEISILKEIRRKIHEIERKINIIKEKRELVMVDRLISIYNRIVQSNNKDKPVEKTVNKKSKEKETNKYINFIFGLNKNKKNNEFRTLSSKTNRNRIKSALLLKKRKIIIDYYNKENNTYNNNIDNTNNNYSNKIIESNSNDNIKSNTFLQRNKNTKCVINKNDDCFSTNKNNTNKIFYDENVSQLKNNSNADERSTSIGNKISEIITSKIGNYIPKDKKLILKMSKKLNRFSNKHTQKKLIGLYDPINQIIGKEYSNLLNWLDIHQSVNIQSKNTDSINNDRKFLYKIKSSPKHQLYLSKSSQNNTKRVIKRPLSNIHKQKITNSNKSEKPLTNEDTFKNRKNQIFLLYSNSLNKNQFMKKINTNVGKKKVPHILFDKKLMPNLKKEINNEKFMKQILGTRYRDQFISYKEKKLIKLIEKYNIQQKFLNKSKNSKIKLYNSQTSLNKDNSIKIRAFSA